MDLRKIKKLDSNKFNLSFENSGTTYLLRHDQYFNVLIDNFVEWNVEMWQLGPIKCHVAKTKRSTISKSSTVEQLKSAYT